MIIYYTHRYSGNKGESRMLLRRALAKYTGDGKRAAELAASIGTCGDFGKPCIPGFDGFSVSHSGNSWAVLIAGCECGLDIQYPRAGKMRKTALRFYHPDDAAAVADKWSDEEASAEFFYIWTRREALVKAAGMSVAASDVPSVLGSTAVYEGREWVVRDVTLPDAEDLSAAICLPADYRDADGIKMIELEVTDTEQDDSR